ncbi:MAG: hypothetical protein EXX96DRAFT_575165 [Benjaminiella poitrasii]|nr:MAG: hypothetical protein EXX96DRAFT_575165 [Benjaminiella poitrasii]
MHTYTSFLHANEMPLLLVLHFVLSFIYSVNAASITPNYKSSCTLLDNKIYCFSGGYVSLGDIVVRRALDESHYLDLTAHEMLVVDETSSKWIPLPDNDSNYKSEAVLGASTVAITNTTYILDGGYNETPFIKNITRSFDSKTNQWSTISTVNRTFTDSIYMGTAVYVSKQKKIYYWGGLIGPYPGRPVNDTTVLNINQNFAWTLCTASLPSGTSTRFGHTATLDKDGINILYIGGRIRTTPNNTQIISMNQRTIPSYYIIPMTEILTYNTVEATWSLRISPSTPTMSNRYMHTANLLSYSGKVLIYGGATDNGNERRPEAVSDYLYLFDPNTLEFTRIDENEQSIGAGPRFGHSAVLCNNTLIVLFGVNQKGLLTDDIYFLSLSGTATWLKTFSLSTSDDNGLSKQTIIGISIGAVISALIIAGGLIYTALKYRMKKKTGIEQHEDHKVNNDLPKLHREFSHYSSSKAYLFDQHHSIHSPPNVYSAIADNNDTITISTPDSNVLPVYVGASSSDSFVFHDSTTLPHGFSFYDPSSSFPANSTITLQKPNQIITKHPIQQLEEHQKHSSSGGLYSIRTSVDNTQNLLLVNRRDSSNSLLRALSVEKPSVI